jgi:predicted transcriptional regulator
MRGSAIRDTIRRVQKTTLYLPHDLKAAIEREARQRGVSEARVIREAIADAVVRPAPRGGLFASRKAMASRVDELLAGFGER